jgi:hypothetical protein
VIVLVTGGRDYADWYTVRMTLDLIGVTLLVHGCARGADRLAEHWAQDRGVQQHAYAADWQRLGKAAGPIRNQRMLDYEPGIQLVVAFPGNSGTADMVKRARRKGIAVVEVG